ncbi:MULTISPECIES: DnaT-like ssDNA-binding domain-containing protein [unclassified Pseudomonas]|uniref:DnaT-like ssDNA-binding domain-containing protein n=1 Tax=unclassified Pseudomonas TaxID=196821 RepID=UPI00235E3A48|nr:MULTISPECIES: DnaT-like ssDNA-binding domain-containing protein [unclassified Pseudomonas]
MTAVLVNDDEWALFAGEPAELLKLYVALKRRMDFATGIAGKQTLINEIVLREGFTVDPIPGRPTPKPVTREQYRSAVRRLEKIGALKVVGPLVFEFPHARTHQSAQKSYNRATTELQPGQQPSSNQPELSNDEGSSQEEGGAATGLFFEQPASSNLLPESGNTPPPSPRACATDSRTRFAMTADWEPNPQTFKATLTMNAMAGVQIQPDQLLEFRSFWIANPDEHRTQARWEHALAQHLKREHRHAQANPGRLSSAEAAQNRPARGQPGRGRNLSATEQVREAIERGRFERAQACGPAAHGAAGATVDHDGGDLRPPLDGEFWRDSEA